MYSYTFIISWCSVFTIEPCASCYERNNATDWQSALTAINLRFPCQKCCDRKLYTSTAVWYKAENITSIHIYQHVWYVPRYLFLLRFCLQSANTTHIMKKLIILIKKIKICCGQQNRTSMTFQWQVSHSNPCPHLIYIQTARTSSHSYTTYYERVIITLNCYHFSIWITVPRATN